jgi:hypothetical protein
VNQGVTMKRKRPKNIYYPESEEELDLVPGHEDSPSRLTGGPGSSLPMGSMS